MWYRKLVLRDIAVVETLFSIGLRISELCHVQNNLFDLKNRVLCIQGKGGKERYLQIENRDVLVILEVYKSCFIEDIKQHGSITTTQIYTYVSTEKEKEILRTGHPRNKMHLE